MQDELIDIPQAAALIGRSHTVVQKLTKRGDLVVAKVEKLGKQTRRYYKRGDVEAYKRRRDGETPSE